MIRLLDRVRAWLTARQAARYLDEEWAWVNEGNNVG